MLYLVLVAAILADQTEPNVTKAGYQKYMATTGRHKAASTIAEKKERLAAAKRARIDRRLTEPSFGGGYEGPNPPPLEFRFPSEKSKREYVDALSREILGAADSIPPDLHSWRMSVGEVGLLVGLRHEVSRESDSRRAVVDRVLPEGLVCTVGTAKPVEVLLRINTEGVVDGTALSLEETIWEVVGTVNIGGKTIFELRPFSPKPKGSN